MSSSKGKLASFSLPVPNETRLQASTLLPLLLRDSGRARGAYDGPARKDAASRLTRAPMPKFGTGNRACTGPVQMFQPCLSLSRSISSGLNWARPVPLGQLQQHLGSPQGTEWEHVARALKQLQQQQQQQQQQRLPSSTQLHEHCREELAAQAARRCSCQLQLQCSINVLEEQQVLQHTSAARAAATVEMLAERRQKWQVLSQAPY
ncbi:hypothetical protein COO60DRAFT_1637575 [Scenedesmus sp. NREL 46B-D3]|nr:hypothetical protein COO60DRAFT_1637575 [Scenedesmus sp. NREL 46B-D3]